MDAILVRNPISGQPIHQAAFREALEVFRLAGWDVEVRETERKDHARDLVREAALQGCRTIIIAGGDGSIEQAVDGIVQSGRTEVRLGIIPTGTGNVFARDTGLPFPQRSDTGAPARAARIIIAGDTVPVDVGLANGNAFLCWAGSGLDSVVADRVEHNLEFKRRAPVATYAAEVVRQALRYRSPHIRVETDTGEVIEDRFSLIVASNIALYARYFRVTPDARLDDGFLQFVALRSDALTSLAINGFKLLLTPDLPHDAVIRRRVRRLHITASPPQVYHLDGDPLGHTPLTIEVLPRRLPLILDRAAAAHCLAPDGARTAAGLDTAAVSRSNGLD